MKRKEINSEVRRDINDYWTEDKRAELQRRIRKAIFSVVGKFEEEEEKKVQNWAHRMIPANEYVKHIDRIDVKASIRKYMRQQTMLHLGLQSYFPHLYSQETVFYECPFCGTHKIKKLTEGGYKCHNHNCGKEFGKDVSSVNTVNKEKDETD